MASQKHQRPNKANYQEALAEKKEVARAEPTTSQHIVITSRTALTLRARVHGPEPIPCGANCSYHAETMCSDLVPLQINEVDLYLCGRWRRDSLAFVAGALFAGFFCLLFLWSSSRSTKLDCTSLAARGSFASSATF